VGVVGAVRHYGLASAPRETVYRPYAQFTPATVSIVLRVRGESTPLDGAVRTAVREIDPRLAVSPVTPFASLVSRSTAQPALQARLIGLFGFAAIGLAVFGLHALLRYLVSARTREIAVRVALGATRHRIVRGVVRETLQLAGIGALVGLVLTAIASQQQIVALDHLLEAHVVAGAVTILLLAIGAAAVAPAYRASRIDPAVALRRDG
jgi:ABC-type antimicrobial peptide transport system permease subunit